MKVNPLVSICIPCYEMNGKGVEFLNYSFEILKNQSYKNFEIIIFGNTPNINFAIKKSYGEIIKILFQDDFLFDSDSLFHLVFNFVGNHNHWLISACCHTKDGVNFYNPLYPKYHDNIHYGENTISSPSVLMFKNENVIEFDENLCWLMDVDYYKMLYDKFGLPSICNYVTVVNRSHPDSITNSKIVDFDVKKEIEYIKNKFTI